MKLFELNKKIKVARETGFKFNKKKFNNQTFVILSEIKIYINI